MNLFSTETKEPNPNNSYIQAGDSVFMEYDDKKAFGTCIEVDKELLVIDFTELSSEQKIDKFLKGVWKKL